MTKQDANANEAIQFAVARGESKIVQIFLDAGIDAAAFNYNPTTPNLVFFAQHTPNDDE
eukprot:m.26591 g.26591  ORF g.26591 m.26591 type:complete len:59 (+) comp15460_c0_seq1:336-512(+)